MQIETVCLAGGGVRAACMLGCLMQFQEGGHLRHVKNLVGTSSGAVVAAALALGKDMREVFDVGVMAFRYEPDVDLDLLDTKFGLDTGKSVDMWIRAVLGDRGSMLTFRQVLDQFGRSLVVCCTNVTRRKPVYFSAVDHPDMPIGTALRMSCSIPFLFGCVQHGGELFCDGAVCDNFPLDVASGLTNSGGEVLGVRYGGSGGEGRSCSVDTMDAYFKALLECMVSNQIGGVSSQRGGPDSNPRVTVLKLDALSEEVCSVRLDTPKVLLSRLFDAGRRAADEHLATCQKREDGNESTKLAQ